jgi:hypothetical protein
MPFGLWSNDKLNVEMIVSLADLLLLSTADDDWRARRTAERKVGGAASAQ